MIAGMLTTASARTLNAVSDRADIAPEYRTAVGVLYTLRVLDGFPDGTFRPETTVNRAQMTNIIYDMVNGVSTAPPELATVFPDVVPGSGAYWARGYIAWAHGEGIVVGFPDGTFRPNETVTIVEAATMLLRALGYGRMGEFQGSGWAQNVSNTALREGIFSPAIVDNFDIMDGAERQVAAQMVFNTLFIARVTFVDALNIYTPLLPSAQRYFGQWRFQLPTTQTPYFTTPRNAAPVIVAGPNVGGVTQFVNLDGSAVAANMTGLRFPVTNAEVGRVVNVFAHGDRILFMDVLSTDVVVPASATVAERLAALGVTNATAIAPNFRGRDVMVVEDGLLNVDRTVSIAPITAAITTGGTGPAVNVSLFNNTDQTWVLFNDGTRTAFRTVLFSTRTVEDVSVVGSTVYIGDLPVPRAQVDFVAPLTPANMNADPTVLTGAAVRGRWANVERSIVNGVTRFRLTEVITRTGIVEEMTMGAATGTQIRFAGSTEFLNVVTPPFSDRAQFSTRLWNRHDPQFDAFLLAGLPHRNTQLWTAHISGVTGNVVAVERFSPLLGTEADLAMLVTAGWDEARQVATATFVRTDGTVETRVAAMPLMNVLPGFTLESQVRAAMSAMTGRVVWFAEFSDVYFMTLLTYENSATIDWIQISPAGEAGGNTTYYVNLSLSNAQQPHIFTPSFVDSSVVQQVRLLNTDTRFIASNGNTAMFPIAPPAGQAFTDPGVTDVIYLLDPATLERVPTVFVVTHPFGQGTLIPVPPAPVATVTVPDSEIPFMTWSSWPTAVPFATITVPVTVANLPDGVYDVTTGGTTAGGNFATDGTVTITNGVGTVTITAMDPTLIVGGTTLTVTVTEPDSGVFGTGVITLVEADPAVLTVANISTDGSAVIYMGVTTQDLADGTVLVLQWSGLVAAQIAPSTVITTVQNNQATITINIPAALQGTTQVLTATVGVDVNQAVPAGTFDPAIPTAQGTLTLVVPTP